MAVRAETRGGAARRVAITDCDVHNSLPDAAHLKRYLPERWHVYYDHGFAAAGGAGLTVGARPHRDIYRRDTVPAGGLPGSDLALMQEQLLDRYHVQRAIVHPIIMVLRNVTYGELGGAVARALNEWMVAEWLEQDDRIYGSISVPVEDGLRAAAEIERAAEHPRFVKVMLTMQTREGMGHPKYWPIYEAAVEAGLPLAAHVGGFSGTHMATGWPTYWVEQHSAFTQPYAAQIVSLIYSGVFDRLPELQFLLEEGGLGWMPSLMWRLDHAWENAREHVPHMTEPPSAVIRRHFSFTTQPLDEPEHPRYLLDVLDQLGMSDRIMFSSDYPHWDFDDPTRILPASLVGADLREAILTGNAERLFHFDRG